MVDLVDWHLDSLWPLPGSIQVISAMKYLTSENYSLLTISGHLRIGRDFQGAYRRMLARTGSVMVNRPE